MVQHVPNALTILRLSSVKQRTGLSRSTIYAQMACGQFPRKISLGARSVGWIESEIEMHLRSRIEASRMTQTARTNGATA